MLEVCELEPWHIAAIDRQPSQRVQYGMEIGEIGDAECADLADPRHGVRVAFLREGVPVAVMGVAETFAGCHGIAWAILAPGIGPDHLAMTREARRRLDRSGLARIELVAVCADIEPTLAIMPDLDPVAMVEALTRPGIATPEVRWALQLGFRPAHVLRKYGAAGETHLLFERIASSSGAVGKGGRS